MTLGYQNKMHELEARKEEITKKNAILREKIAEMRELTEKYDKHWTDGIDINKYGGLRGGQYGIMRNLPNFEDWKDTVFWKYKDDFNGNNWTLKRLPEREIVGNDLIRPEWGLDFDFNIIAYCDMVMPTSSGPIVHIVDPFGECTLPPAKMVSISDAQKLIGSLVSVTCIMRYYQKEYEVIGFERLPYTLHKKTN